MNSLIANDPNAVKSLLDAHGKPLRYKAGDVGIDIRAWLTQVAAELLNAEAQ